MFKKYIIIIILCSQFLQAATLKNCYIKNCSIATKSATPSASQFVYFGQSTANLLIKIQTDLTDIASLNVSMGINDISPFSETEILVGGNPNGYIVNKVSLTITGTLPSYGGAIRGIVKNNNGIWVTGQKTARTINLYSADPPYGLLITGYSPATTVTKMIVHPTSGNLYITAGNFVQKIDGTTGELIATSASYGATINDITWYNNKIYIGGLSTIGKIFRLDEDTLAKEAETTAFGQSINSVRINFNGIYGSAGTFIRRYNIDMSFEIQSETQANAMTYMDLDTNGNLYAIVGTINKVRKFDKNLNYVSETGSYSNALSPYIAII